MTRFFKYDTIKLIEAIRDRPCIWDRSSSSYKDRADRRIAWEEVFCILDENYDDLSDEERRLTGENILHKWTNIRDTFIKSLKAKMGKPKKKYMFYDKLKFLIPSVQIDPDDTRPTFETSVEIIDMQAPEIKTEADDETPKHSRRKRSKKHDYSEEQPKTIIISDESADIAESDEYNDPRIMNEDEAFFASLLPSVVSYSEDERLEFRIEVLSVMKRITDKRK